LSLSIPEKVRFRYSLSGVDKGWQDGGTRRETIYNNLGPGHYTFRVIAANNDGVWNEDGATLHFDIAPKWFQTVWFRLFCIAMLLAFIWTLYQFRLRSLAREFEVALDARVAERTRIAQDLHDTFLQGLISASMQLGIAYEHLPDVTPVKRSIAHVLELMRDAVEDSRGAVSKLRNQDEGTEGLAMAFSSIPEQLKSETRARFRVLVKGETFPLRPLVSDEIYRIGKEAIVNAFRHSNAGEIEVEIDYGKRWLGVAVRDNGVGIDPEVLKVGREGHFGLVGMRERAQRIGARLRVLTRAAEGTEVELVIPRRSVVAAGRLRNSRH
jgi:signal transduction histidine kinase